MKSTYSVVIPAYNAAPWLDATVGSVLAQELPAERIVIVNDGSTDRTWEICQKLDERYAEVIAIQQENQGPSIARNRGFEEVKSNFIAFLDADDQWHPAFARKAVMALEETRNDVFIARAKRFIESVGDLDEDYGPSPAYAAAAPQSILSGIPFAPCMVMLRSASFQQIGGFRGGDVYWEDWDLWIRIAETGARFCFDDGNPLVYYRDTPGSRSEDACRCFGKSVATLDLHWSSSLASGRVKRRAKARYLRWIGKASEGIAERFHYFARAFLLAPWDLKNFACLAMTFSCTKSSHSR